MSVKGPKGTLEQSLPGRDRRRRRGRAAWSSTRRDDSKTQKALHGLSRALLANAVTGVTEGLHARSSRSRASATARRWTGRRSCSALGYTHAIRFPIPEGIQIAVDKQTKLSVSGVDRQAVGQVAAEIRALRPPDVYKGKGIRYAARWCAKKAGKTGAK